MFIFDGAAKTIKIIDDVVDGQNQVTFTPEELWTAYVDWSAQGDNLKYSRALEVTGGNDIGGGEAVGNYVFIRNDLGWIGIPPATDGVSIIVNGSLYGKDPNKPVIASVPGQAVNLIINRSVVSTLRTVSGGSGLSSEEHDKLMALVCNSGFTVDEIASAVWNKVI